MTGIPETHRSLDRERNPRPVLVGVAAVAALVLALAWIGYDPVETGDVAVCPPTAREVPAGDLEDPGAAGVVCAISNRDTTTVEFAASAYNGGLLPVRITDVGLRGEIQQVFFVDEILMWPGNNQREDVDSDLVPFEPFRLAPGDERLVWVRASVPACEDAARDRVLLFRELPLRTGVFGLPRDSQITLDPPVRVIVERC